MIFYLFFLVKILPRLPVLLWQAHSVRREVPDIPEAALPTGSEGDKDANQPIRLIILGESTMAGVGVSTHKEGFAGSLGAIIHKNTGRAVFWDVFAESGATVEILNTCILPNIEQKTADFIIVGIGANDAFSLTNPIRWRLGIHRLVHGLREKFPGTEIVFINMPPIRQFPALTPLLKKTMGDYIDHLSILLGQIICDMEHVYFMDEVLSLKKWPGSLPKDIGIDDYFSDGVHPSKLTYRLWAEKVFYYLKELELIPSHSP
jgi:lysophospholipase L1-like esterase